MSAAPPSFGFPAGRAVVIGEALVDVVHHRDGSVAEHPGGSPANVALGLARLGREVELIAWLGKDAHGEAVAAHLESSGVTIAPASWGAASTSLAIATLDASMQAAYEFDLEWALSPDANLGESPLVVHTGSIAAVLEPGATAVAKLLREAKGTATVTYDPNARPSLMGEPANALAYVETMIGLSDVVKVSDEDIAWLTGASPDDIAPRWIALGARLVVVTRGGDGASAYLADGRRIDVSAQRVDVVDTVGAGDSFMGGLIDGLWSAGLLGAESREALGTIPESTLRSILERCARIAAITVSRAGANPPTSAELS